MADNLKLIEERIDIEIDPTGAPGSILAENHNGIEKEILRKTGKYTGSPFVAKKESTLFPSGTLSWNGNAMNNVSNFLITTSKLTSDLTDFGNLLSTMAIGDLIQFKDYSGRTVFLEFQSYVSSIDGSMNPIYEITVKGFADNLNYVYQVNESSVAVLSFIKKIVDLSLLVSKLERLTVPVPNVQNVIELDGENHFIEFQNNGQGFFDYFILGANYIGGQNHPLQFRNATDSPIVLKNMINSGTSIIGETPLFFPNGLNLILEPRETVQFCYNADNNRFDYVGASFEIEISDVNGLQDELDLKASKTYVDGLVVGLLDDRGNYDASTNLFPSTGGSGTSGAILKGDLWYISIAGTLGGQLVNIGDSIRALTDAPGQTSGNWDILESNIGYVPENTANKSTDVEVDKTSNVKFSTVKSIYDWAVGKFQNILIPGTTIKNINGQSLLGSGNIITTSEISIQNNAGVEQFKITDNIRFENVSFDAGNKKISIDSLAPLAVYLDVVNGSDVTGVVENSKKPFKTFEAMLSALPTTTGETYNVYLLGGTIPIVRRIVPRNLTFYSRANATLDFSAIKESDGTTVASYAFTTGTICTWTFTNENISILATNTNGFHFEGALSSGNIILKGRMNTLEWRCASISYLASFNFGSGSEIYIKTLIANSVAGKFIGSGGGNAILIKLEIGTMNVTTFNNPFFAYFSGTVKINNIVKTNMAVVNNLTISSQGSGNFNLEIGNVTYNGTITFVTTNIKFNESVVNDLCYLAFNGYVTGKIISNNYHNAGSQINTSYFDNFVCKLRGMYHTGGLVTFRNCDIQVSDFLLYREASAVPEAVLFLGSNTIIQNTLTENLIRDYPYGNESLAVPTTVTVNGTLKTNAQSLGSRIKTIYASDTFKEKSKEVIIRSKKDLISKPLDSSVTYVVDGTITFLAGEYVIVPETGLTLTGYGFDVSKLIKNVVSESIFSNALKTVIASIGANVPTLIGQPKQTDDYIELDGVKNLLSFAGNKTDFSFTQSGADVPFSIRQKVMFLKTTNTQSLMGKVYYTSNNEYYFYADPTNLTIRLFSQGSSVNYLQATCVFSKSINVWYDLVVTYNGSGVIKIYVNGIDQTVTTTTVGTYTYMTYQSGTATKIGSTVYSSFDYDYLKARIKQMGVWKNYMLTPSDVTTIYNSGSDLAFASIVQTGLVAFWKFNEKSGSGNFVSNNIEYNSGLGDVFRISDIDGSHAIELNDVNFIGCASLGVIRGYRQFTGTTCGIYSCSDGFMLEGVWNGFKLVNTNSFTFGASGTLIKKGIGVLTTFANRLYLDLNLSLPTGAKICDFDESNFLSNKLLQIVNCLVKVNGVIDPATTSATFPNISPFSTKVYFTNNIGVKNSFNEPYGLKTVNLSTYANDSDAGTGGIQIGEVYIETTTGYFKTRLT